MTSLEKQHRPKQQAEVKKQQHRPSRCCVTFVLSAVAAALPGIFVAMLVLESLDDPTVEHENWYDHIRQNEMVEEEVAAIVPNYRKVFWARNLIFVSPDLRGRLGAKMNSFGKRMLEWNCFLPGNCTWEVNPWLDSPVALGACSLDSDGDGYTNGQELGDPCCIWEGKHGPDVAWTWDLTHPGGPWDPPIDSMQKLINKTDCEEVRRTGRYPDYSDEFDAFFYRDFEQEGTLTDKFVRLVFLCLYFGALLWWTLEKELWREILCFVTFSRRRATDRTLSLCTGIFLFFFAYAHNDLSSAFVHSFFDNCYRHHSLVGGQCKGTQYHHFKPRSQSLEPLLLIIGNPIAILPAAAIIVLYGYLGSGFRYPTWLKTGYQYPRWFEFLLLSLAAQAPLTYYFHQAAHTPDADRPVFLTWLQQAGLALSPELHKVHHRRPNGTWSVMVGWMDFIPNFLSTLPLGEFGIPPARAALLAIAIILILPWYAWLFYFERHNKYANIAVGSCAVLLGFIVRVQVGGG